ncbi:MAG TPA: DUF2243 domain-containing protein [Abditibacterium sp.]|jgi:uncharacterized membrane protein
MANSHENRRGPLLTAGILIGAGMGGFVDGIVLHQILQWHNMLSSRIAPDTLVNSKINMFWDGIFHAGVWLMTALGIALLFHAGSRGEVLWSKRVFGGAVLLGYGLFNLIEGTINHQILGLHHVHEYAPNRGFYDAAFLMFGAVLVAIGWIMIRGEKKTGQ